MKLRVFAKSIHTGDWSLIKMFNRFFPEEYIAFVESKNSESSKNYYRGRLFEWNVRRYFRVRGYFVLISPRSRSPVDLAAIKKGRIFFIQCKTNGYIGPEERRILKELCMSVGTISLISYKNKHEILFKTPDGVELCIPDKKTTNLQFL